MQTKITKGELLTLATGEYSDYSVRGVFRALSDFDPQEQIAKFISENPQDDGDNYYDLSEFIGWVARSGLLEPVDSREWHIGSYGRFDSTLG